MWKNRKTNNETFAWEWANPTEADGAIEIEIILHGKHMLLKLLRSLTLVGKLKQF